tara:strand:+ start:1054 stop:2520 length:1467 start_codon:yes stop_codon:yes gene_type:complete
MYFDRKNFSYYSSFLIRLAWTVEVIAVCIGFMISILVSVSAFRSSTESIGFLDSSSSILIAGLPFLLIAVVELCKIPLVFTFMNVRSRYWRSVFLFFVLFLCLITFETMLNGFERNFSNLNRAIDNRNNEVVNIDSQISLLEKRRDYAQKFTEDELLAEVDLKTSVLDKTLSQNVRRVNASETNQLSEIDRNFEPQLDMQIGELMLLRDGYYADWNSEKELIEERFTTMLVENVSGSRDERTRLLVELEILKEEMRVAMDDASFFTRSNVEKKYRQLIREKEQQLGSITNGYLGGGALEKQSLMENQLRQQIEFVNAKYERRITDVNDRIDSKKQTIIDRSVENEKVEIEVASNAKAERGRYYSMTNREKNMVEAYLQDKRSELEIITAKVFEFDQEIFTLQNDQRILKNENNQLINQNQVYRLAMYIYGKNSVEDVNKRMLGIVAVLWFGSLALIASVTGVMLALASFYLRRFAEELDNEERMKAQS